MENVGSVPGRETCTKVVNISHASAVAVLLRPWQARSSTTSTGHSVHSAVCKVDSKKVLSAILFVCFLLLPSTSKIEDKRLILHSQNSLVREVHYVRL